MWNQSVVVSSLEIRPVSRNQRLTTVGQHEHELQAAGHAGVPENLQRLSFKRVMRPGDRHAFWKVLMVGSVWWFPSTRYRTTS